MKNTEPNRTDAIVDLIKTITPSSVLSKDSMEVLKRIEQNRIVVGSIADLGHDPCLEYKMDKFFYDYDKIEPSFLDQDESCHWYIIPEKNRAEWDKWRETPSEWDYGEPWFAERIDGHPRSVVFWRIDSVDTD